MESKREKTVQKKGKKSQESSHASKHLKAILLKYGALLLLCLALEYGVLQFIDFNKYRIKEWITLFFYFSQLVYLVLLTIINLKIMAKVWKFRSSKDGFSYHEDGKEITISFGALYRYDLDQWKKTLAVFLVKTACTMFLRASYHLYSFTIVQTFLPWFEIRSNYLFDAYLFRSHLKRVHLNDVHRAEEEERKKTIARRNNSVMFGST